MTRRNWINKFVIAACLVCVALTPAAAQDLQPREEHRREMEERIRERFASMLRGELALSDEQAETVLPAMADLEQFKREIGRERREDDAAAGDAAHPFRTLERARDALRSLRAQRELPKGGATIVIGAGRYARSATFLLEEEDGGRADAPVHYVATPDAEGDGGDDGAVRFRREVGFTDPGTILSHMSQHERSVVFELVEIDVAADYERREQELRASLEAQRESDTTELRQASQAWAEDFAAKREKDLQEMAAACARLSLDLAEKIVIVGK